LRIYTELKVWQKSHKLVLEVFRVTAKFPKEEKYGLTSQMRRASFSIPANIAEGCAKEGDKDFARFLQISLGSANELEYFFLLTRDLHMLGSETYEKLQEQITETRKMLVSFIVSLRKK